MAAKYQSIRSQYTPPPNGAPKDCQSVVRSPLKLSYLMLGLPLTTFNKNSNELFKKFLGDHTNNQKGDVFRVENCAVYPQPLGAYAAYLETPIERHTSPQMALIVDIGHNTVDWLTCEGMVANPG